MACFCCTNCCISFIIIEKFICMLLGILACKASARTCNNSNQERGNDCSTLNSIPHPRAFSSSWRENDYPTPHPRTLNSSWREDDYPTLHPRALNSSWKEDDYPTPHPRAFNFSWREDDYSTPHPRAFNSSWREYDYPTPHPRAFKPPPLSYPYLLSGSEVYVQGYYRNDGTYVRPHTRSYPTR